MQIADGTLAEVHGMLHRMTELSIKAANGTNTAADRQAIQSEINELSAEITRIGETTKAENMTAAESRIRDTDMSTEMMKLTTANILSQAGSAVLSQTMQNPQSVLSLLQ